MSHLRAAEAIAPMLEPVVFFTTGEGDAVGKHIVGHVAADQRPEGVREPGAVDGLAVDRRIPTDYIRDERCGL